VSRSTGTRRVASLLVAGCVVAGCIPATATRESPGGSGAVATDQIPTAATRESPGGSGALATDQGPAATPGPSGPSFLPSFTRPTPTPLPTFLAYTVRPGDTLTSIATRFETTARSIAFWNRALHPSLDPDSPIYQPDRIAAGWTLLLVPGVELDPEDLPEESATRSG
jgi:nucleoid-associated protein YgaU